MQVSNTQENTIPTRNIYVGVENFYPVAVNPTLKELNDMGIPATMEPEYYGKITRDYGSGEQEYDFFTVTIMLDNKDEITPIKTQVQYTVIRDYHLSSTGKYKVLNKYGSSTWLEDETAPLPSNMQWYVDEEVKKAYRGEEQIVMFIKALRGLTNVNKSTPETEKSKGMMMLEQSDLDKMFNGDFRDIKSIILDTDNDPKVGFLLGARVQDDNIKQGIFNRLPLRSYIRATNNTDYLIKQVADAQSNGVLSTTVFDLNDTKLKVFDPNTITETSEPSFVEEHDDLPF